MINLSHKVIARSTPYVTTLFVFAENLICILLLWEVYNIALSYSTQNTVGNAIEADSIEDSFDDVYQPLSSRDPDTTSWGDSIMTEVDSDWLLAQTKDIAQVKNTHSLTKITDETLSTLRISPDSFKCVKELVIDKTKVTLLEQCMGFSRAVEEDPINIAKQLSRGPIQQELLAWAVRWGHTDIANLLLANGADVDATVVTDGPLKGWTPLQWAAYAGKLETVEALLQAGADVKAPVTDGPWIGYTPLHWAACYNHPEIVEALIDAGAEVDSKGKNGKTPLSLATRFDLTEVAELLLSNGADVNAADKKGTTPLHETARLGRATTAKALLEAGAEVTATVTDGDYKGYTPLHITAFNGYTAIAKALLEAGAEVNAKNNYGRTPLHLAAENGHLEIVQFLMKKKANLVALDFNGKTPLQVAEKNGKIDVVKLLKKPTHFLLDEI